MNTYVKAYKKVQANARQLRNKRGKHYEHWKAAMLVYFNTPAKKRKK